METKKEYASEAEFLANYNVSKYKQLSLSADILLFSVSEETNYNYRKNSEKKMSILLIKRHNYPYKDMWCLPGGFLNPETETLDDCTKRILKTETNLSNIYLEQLYTYDGIDRDPRCRVVSTSYMALVDKNRLTEKVNENASWFDITMYNDDGNLVTVVLDNGTDTIKFSIKKILRELTTDRYTFKIDENKDVAFDHPLVIVSGMERLRNKVGYTDIVFNMMPKLFTLGELQKVYEAILGRTLLMPAFRRIIADKVEKTEKIQGGGGHRPSSLFKYKK
jgi:ADP-ribose pyrophosphatase YjhB (NUDIX family)